MLLLLPCLWAVSARGTSPTFGGTLWWFATASTFESSTTFRLSITLAFGCTFAKAPRLIDSLSSLKLVL